MRKLRITPFLVAVCVIAMMLSPSKPARSAPRPQTSTRTPGLPWQGSMLLPDGRPSPALQRALAQSGASLPGQFHNAAPFFQAGSSSGSNPFFYTAQSYPSGGQYTNSVAVGDFNGDGKPDLVVANENSCFKTPCPIGSVSVFLGNGDGTYQAAVTYSSGGYEPYSVAVGDFNGDGKLDIVVANDCGSAGCSNGNALGSVSVLLGSGDGTFEAAVSYASGGYSALSVTTGDFNGDGKLDIVVTNVCGTDASCKSDGSAGVLLGNGDGTFQTAVTYAAGNAPDAIAVGDFNGDGKPDLVVTNPCETGPCPGAGAISILLNNGNGSFQTPVSYASGGEDTESAIAVGDFNGDGKLDVAVGSFCTASDYCEFGVLGVLLGNGDGTFKPAVIYDTEGYFPSSIAVADLNGDGKPDLVVGQWVSPWSGWDSVGIFLGNGDGTFQAPTSYASGGSQGHGVAVADLNGDGKQDVILADAVFPNPTEGSVSVLLGNGNGTFQAVLSNGEADASWAAASDLNGDGKLDLVVVGPCIGLPGCVSGFVSVYLGNGNGTFQAPLNYPTGGYNFGGPPTGVAIGDFNGDGKPDIAVLNQCANSSDPCNTVGSVGILLGNGDGTFQPAVSYAVGGDYPSALVVGDFNGDGKLDLAVASCTPNTGFSCPGPNSNGLVNVLLGSGDGTFQTPVTTAVGTSGNGSVILAGDFNGDGKLDVAFTEDAGGLDILLGNGNGTFQAPITTNLGEVLGLASGDLNGDGKLDLVATTYSVGADTVIALLGNGDGTFEEHYSEPVSAAYGVILSDFNGDGNLDAATVGNEVELFLGNGDGTFQSPLTYNARGSGLVAGDFNGDGKPDLAVTTSAVFVLLNVGSRPSPTTTTLTSSLNPSVYGQSVALTATVTWSGAGTPTGSITFMDGTTSLGSVQLSNGLAVLNLTTLAAGSHSITAAYGGSGFFDASTSAAVSQVVNQATSSVTVVSSQNPSGYGQAVTFTATIAPQYGGVATGSITFKNGSAVLGSRTVASNAASFTTNTLSLGSHLITASYAGDANVLSSTSAQLVQAVTKNATTTSLSASANPIAQGQSVTFTATVSSSIGAPPNGETVTFRNGSTALGTGALSGGVATFSTSSLPAGTDPIVATYPGDATFSPSNSATLKETVNKYATTATVASNLNPSSDGQTVTFTATVSASAGGTPTGTVTFKNGSAMLGAATLSGGTGNFATTTLTVGTHSITAVYGGDATHAGSTSAALSQVVNKAGTMTALASSQNPSTSGQSVTFTATVTSSTTGVPTGAVIFKSGTKALGSATLSGGKASVSTTTLAVGSDTITATYNGSANYSGSSATLTQTVN